jgi:histidyl-tRNA synthetase
LLETLGGPKLPGVGFGMGMERLLLVMEAQGIAPVTGPLLDVYVCAQDETARRPAMSLMMALRRAGIHADADHMGRSLKAQFKHADRSGARFTAVLGEEELRDGTVTLRDMTAGEEHRCPLGDVVEAARVRLDAGKA